MTQSRFRSPPPCSVVVFLSSHGRRIAITLSRRSALICRSAGWTTRRVPLYRRRGPCVSSRIKFDQRSMVCEISVEMCTNWVCSPSWEPVGVPSTMRAPSRSLGTWLLTPFSARTWNCDIIDQLRVLPTLIDCNCCMLQWSWLNNTICGVCLSSYFLYWNILTPWCDFFFYIFIIIIILCVTVLVSIILVLCFFNDIILGHCANVQSFIYLCRYSEWSSAVFLSNTPQGVAANRTNRKNGFGATHVLYLCFIFDNKRILSSCIPLTIIINLLS